MVIQHGPPGDSKSVMLWLVCQILYYYDKKTYEGRLEKWKQDVVAHKQAAKRRKDAKIAAKRLAKGKGKADGVAEIASDDDSGNDSDAVDKPAKPEAPDRLLNRSTWIGMGQFLEKQGGSALLGLHEGKNWLNNTMDGGVGGGVEDLNQVMDHDVYKNSPANASGKFNVRNPHMPGIVLMHLPELTQQFSKDDTVAGMMRFLIAKFPSVVNKVQPEGLTESQLHDLTASDDYFNNLEYDVVVKCMAHVLLVRRA